MKIILELFNKLSLKNQDLLMWLIVIIIISLIVYVYTHRISSKWISLDKFKKIKPEIKMPIFREFLNDTWKAFQIEFILTFEKQQDYLNEQYDRIYERLIQIHRHLLKSKGVNNIENNLQIKILGLLLDSMMCHIKKYIEKEFKTEFKTRFLKEENINDTYEFIERDFESYYLTLMENVKIKAKAYMRKKWIDVNSRVKCTSNESWKATEPDLNYNGELGFIIKDICKNAVKILLVNNKEKKELSKKIDNNMMKAACYE